MAVPDFSADHPRQSDWVADSLLNRLVSSEERFSKIVRLNFSENQVQETTVEKEWIPLKIASMPNQKWEVSVRNAVDVLGVKEEDLLAVSKAGHLEPYLENLLIEAHYKEQLDAYEKGCCEKGTKAHFNRLQMISAMKLALRALKGRRMGVDSIGEGVVIGKTDDTGRLKSVSIASQKVLGQGSFGKVVLGSNILTGRPKAFKISENDPTAVAALNREARVLREVNPNGKLPGITKPPKVVFPFGLDQKGYMMTYYDGSVFKLIDSPNSPTFREKVRGCYEVLLGMATLHDLDYRHGDLNGYNVLYKRGANGSLHLFIGDFGGVGKKNEDFGGKDLGSFSEDHFPEEDRQQYLPYIRSQKPKDDRFWKLQQGRDVFGAGTILYSLLTGENFLDDAFDFSYREKYPKMTGFFKQFPIPDSVPKPFAELIMQMMDADFEKRPNASEAFSKMHSAIQGWDPALFQELPNASDDIQSFRENI